jgi:SAM-dependent methyltransferase
MSRSLLEDREHEELDKILGEFYEGGRRTSGDGNWGDTFPINPEVLDYLAVKARGQDVLEIAGATGVNCLYLLATGAKSACVVDVSQEELADCVHNAWKLGVTGRLKTFDQDVLQCHGLEEGKYGVIICRNFIHFLPLKKRQKFFKILRKLAQPGATIVISANSVENLLFSNGGEESLQESQQRLGDLREHTFFKIVSLYGGGTKINKGQVKTKHCHSIYRIASAEDGLDDFEGLMKTPVIQGVCIGSKLPRMPLNKSHFENFPPDMQEVIRKQRHDVWWPFHKKNLLHFIEKSNLTLKFLQRMGLEALCAQKISADHSIADEKRRLKEFAQQLETLSIEEDDEASELIEDNQIDIVEGRYWYMPTVITTGGISFSPRTLTEVTQGAGFIHPKVIYFDDQGHLSLNKKDRGPTVGIIVEKPQRNRNSGALQSPSN